MIHFVRKLGMKLQYYKLNKKTPLAPGNSLLSQCPALVPSVVKRPIVKGTKALHHQRGSIKVSLTFLGVSIGEGETLFVS